MNTLEILKKAQDISEKSICELTKSFQREAVILENKATTNFLMGLAWGLVLSLALVAVVYFATGNRLFI
jgi:hypothetical protein